MKVLQMRERAYFRLRERSEKSGDANDKEKFH